MWSAKCLEIDAGCSSIDSLEGQHDRLESREAATGSQSKAQRRGDHKGEWGILKARRVAAFRICCNGFVYVG